MQIGTAPTGKLRQIACDESGYEGEKLVGGETDVFAHAGVGLTVDSATECITELRRRIRSPAQEYKANHLLREKHRPVLEWLLGRQGPICGNAHVHLVDKTFLLVGKVIDLFVGTAPDHRIDALTRSLYREGRHTLGPERWAAFLASSNDLMRAGNRHGTQVSMDSFDRTVDVLRAGISLSGPRVESARTLLVEDPGQIPSLDPLVPAIVRAAVLWSDDGSAPVSILHDRQTALTDERIAAIKAMAGGPGGRLTELRLAGSRSDPRIQVADFLAGVARKVASYELAGRGDAELVALLRPYVDPSSIWGDDRSWSRLGSGCPPADRPDTITS